MKEITPAKAREIMNSHIEERQQEIDMIQEKQAEIFTRLSDADKSIQDASERLDPEAYQAALKEKEAAGIAASMYERRLEQIMAKKMLTEDESDAVIDGLLMYEARLSAEFYASIIEPIRRLRQAHSEYIAAVRDVERTFNEWTTNVHANHREGLRCDGQKVTYDRLAEKARPIRVLPFMGCKSAVEIGSFLDHEPFKSIND